MKVEWLRTALRNLDDKATYIALDNPQAAVHFVKTVKASVEQLSQLPLLGKEGRLPGLPHVVPYRIRLGKLQVLRIFHTRRLPPSK